MLCFMFIMPSPPWEIYWKTLSILIFSVNLTWFPISSLRPDIMFLMKCIRELKYPICDSKNFFTIVILPGIGLV